MNEFSAHCHHCAAVIKDSARINVEVNATPHVFCCNGCAAAAQWLHAGGMGDFYRLRAQPSQRVRSDHDFSAWDSAAFQRLHVRMLANTGSDEVIAEIELNVDGIRCAACAWLIPRIAESMAAVREVDLDAGSARLRLRWQPSMGTLSAIATQFAELGYILRVAQAGGASARAERRLALKRIAVAGLAAMQAMMMSEALYFGGSDLDVGTRDFLRWMALILATPVVLWAAAPFFRGAWLELRFRRLGMDALVALSVGLAYLISVIETLRGGPEVYFDAAVMFVFFLLVARHFEHMSRQRARAWIDRRRTQPQTVRRVDGDSIHELALHEVSIGDVLQVQAGQNVPVDGVLLDAHAELDESLLTGEPLARQRRRGERVIAGSVVLAAPLLMRVEAIGADTWLAQLGRLVDHAQSERPGLQQRAERWAASFVWAMLAIALIAAAVWSQIDSTRIVPVVLAVLAAACPCAFALAVPAALAAAQAELARRGVLVVRADALERAARIDRIAFDKTGTLTEGKPQIVVCERFVDEYSEAQLRALAAALERAHRHPIAHAFADDEGQVVTEARIDAGDGVEGCIDGDVYRLGRQGYAANAVVIDDGRVWLSKRSRVLAAFSLADRVRIDAADCIETLRTRGISSLMLSGDGSAAVHAIAGELGIERARGDLRPAEKLSLLQAEQRAGHRIAMVGDGSNDAPVLAAADLAIAMGEGAALAQRRADVILLRPHLSLLPELLDVARRTQRIVRQNLSWSLAYHALMLPAAVLGVMPPWLAALGMSLSSLLVTLNAARLLRSPGAAREDHAPVAVQASVST